MGAFYCDHCGRKYRYTHDDRAVCLTDRCPNNPRTDREDAQAWRDHLAEQERKGGEPQTEKQT